MLCPSFGAYVDSLQASSSINSTPAPDSPLATSSTENRTTYSSKRLPSIASPPAAAAAAAPTGHSHRTDWNVFRCQQTDLHRPMRSLDGQPPTKKSQDSTRNPPSYSVTDPQRPLGTIRRPALVYINEPARPENKR